MINLFIGSVLRGATTLVFPPNCMNCGLPGVDICTECKKVLTPKPRFLLGEDFPLVSSLFYGEATGKLMLLAKENGYNDDKLQLGLSAQEVQAVAPEIVGLAPFDMETLEDGTIVSKSGENYLTVDYSRLVPLLIEAIKEQQAHINRLEQQINSIGN